MYVIQMADLHIGSSVKTEPAEKDFFERSVELIKEKVPRGSVMLLCLCGDIIDSKGLDSDSDKNETQKRYDEAYRLIEKFVHLLEDFYKIHVECCPGNHDITHINELFDFMGKVKSTCTSHKQLENCYVCKIEDLNFIFVNSCANNQHIVGCINYDALEGELALLPREDEKILVLHHALMSMYDSDSSSIRNAARLVNIVDKYGVTAVLHGHIHGREILKIGEKRCKVIGTGALFSRNSTNINSQFNIIQCGSDGITKVFNCRYNADGGNDPWNICDLSKGGYEHTFKGESFEAVYKQLNNKLYSVTPLYNVVLEIQTDYKAFCDNLISFFREDYLKIGDKKYDYFTLAEMWEADEVPDELYFNHGSYFRTKDVSGIEIVKEQLNKKPTSNRIILATYNTENIIDSLDDSAYLPSLQSIQFGRTGEGKKLLVSMHLRALEAGRFLKINICEIAYILKKLKEGKNAVSFDQIEIVISAFRVQKKERFNCFLKADIDRLTAHTIDAKVNHGKIDELCKLLEEKRDGLETITQIKGIQNVFEAMKASNEEADEDAPVHYNDEILKMFNRVLDVYMKLDAIHKNSSVPGKEEEQCEKEIDNLLAGLVRELKALI